MAKSSSRVLQCKHLHRARTLMWQLGRQVPDLMVVNSSSTPSMTGWSAESSRCESTFPITESTYERAHQKQKKTKNSATV